MDRFLFQDKTSFKAFLQKTEPRQINFYTPKLSLGGVYELSKLFAELIPLHIYLMQSKEDMLATTLEELEIGYQLNQSSKARACVTWIEKEARSVSQFDKEQLGTLTRPTSAVTFERNGASEYLLGNYELTRQFLDGDVKEKPFETIVHADNQTSAIALNQKMAELPWMDARGRAIEHLKRYSKYRKPEEIYYLMLHHLFQKQKKHVFESDPDLLASLIWEKLFDFQRDAAITILDKLECYGGCVLADSVGLGKTYTALAVMMAYQRMGKNVAVLCPKLLEANWKRFNCEESTNPFRHPNGTPIFNYYLFRHSQLKNGTWEKQKGHNLNFSLMVIDESHNFRNDSGSHYQFLQDYLNKNKNTKVLMLTATPINNRVKDLKNQLKLLWHIPNGLNGGPQYDDFKKNVSNVLEAAEAKIENWQNSFRQSNGNIRPLSHVLPPQYFDLLKRYVIARNVDVIRTDYPNFIREKGNFPDESTENATPDIAKGISIREIVAKFEELTFVVYNQLDFFNNNTAASPLLGMLKVGFLKRFESSVESARQTLDALINKMEEVRNRIVRRHLIGGRLNLLKIDDDDREDYVNDESDEKFNVQVTEGKTVKTTPQRVEQFRKVVNNDIQKLADLKKRLDQVTPENDLKLQDLKTRIRQKMADSPVKKMLIFTAYKDTANYLYNNIKGMGYTVACVTGDGVAVDPLNWNCTNQAQVLRYFAPKGQEQPVPQNPIQILIATDCISEGQNLQDCDMVINYDIHWNPVRLTQRNGRINRIGSPHKEIKIVNYWPMPKIDEYLNVYTRIKTRSAIGGTIANANLGGNVQKVDTATFFQNQQLRDMQESNPALRVLARAQQIRLHDTRQFESEYRRLKDDKNQKELFKSITEAPLGVHAISSKKVNENDPSKGLFLLRKKQKDGTAEANENYKFVVLNAENKQLKRKECSDAEALLHCQLACVGNTKILDKQEMLLDGVNAELFEGALRNALKSENDYLDLDNYTLATYLIIGDVNDFTGNPREAKIVNDASVQKEEPTQQVPTPKTRPVQTTLPFDEGINGAPKSQASQMRSAEAYLNLGRTYYRNKFFERSVECFQKAAVGGLAEAQFNLGLCYANGCGVGQSNSEASRWWSKAAEQGHAEAQFNLGKCFFFGKGVGQFYPSAVKWFRKAAKQGHIEAQAKLRECYAKGYGIDQPEYGTLEWCREEAMQGDVNVQYELGLRYANGGGVDQNQLEAVKWLRKSALNGNMRAQFELGRCYEYGHGVEQSYEDAVKCYHQAATKGHALAQYNLGLCYVAGKGITKSYDKAEHWMREAASQGLECACHQLKRILEDLKRSAEEDFELGCAYYNGDGVVKSFEKAVEYFRKAAEQGHASAQNKLGVCHVKGHGVGQSYVEAVKWFRKAAEQGHASAQNKLGVCHVKGHGVGQSYVEAVKWFRKAAEQENADAQYNLGLCYVKGHGVEQSYVEAVKWFRKAVEQGNTDAQYNLGLCYECGRGVEQSWEEAAKLYRKAAEQDHARAQCNLGLCYKLGHGVVKSFEKAIECFRKAAEQGNADAQYNLFGTYVNGEGVKQSLEEAVKWCRKAAEQGHVRALNCLGTCYARGKGVAQSWTEATKWYLRAAEQEDTAAQFNLGVCYTNGYGVSQSWAEAVKWYRKAAEQGYAKSQFKLGFCYEYGKGVKRDRFEAVEWYRKAADQGDAEAKKRLNLLLQKDDEVD